MGKKIYTEIKNYLTKQMNEDTYDSMSVVLLENGIVLWIYTDFENKHSNFKFYDCNHTEYGYFFWEDDCISVLVDRYCKFYEKYFNAMNEKDMDILLPNGKIKVICKNDFMTEIFWNSTKALCPEVWNYENKKKEFEL